MALLLLYFHGYLFLSDGGRIFAVSITHTELSERQDKQCHQATAVSNLFMRPLHQMLDGHFVAGLPLSKGRANGHGIVEHV
jgi:hypothetical protein